MRYVEKNMLDLFRQFCDAYGIKNPNTGDKLLVRRFFNWLDGEKKENDAFYLEQLNEIGVDAVILNDYIEKYTSSLNCRFSEYRITS